MAVSPLTPQAMETYRKLMREIKYRIEAINDVVGTRTVPLRAKIAEEFCYLQLRMICEVIAIACLVIHGNLKPKADLLKSYKADWIMSELSKLHPKFYPNPLENGDRTGLNGNPEWVDKTDGFLTKEDLQQLWSRHCGNILHRGNVKDILGKERPLELPKVTGWVTKIVRLLERHTIVTPDEEWLFYFVMNEITTGEVASNLFARLPDRPATSHP